MYNLDQILNVEQNLKPVDAEQLFDDYLDMDGTVEILGMQYCKSTILKEVDPTAYRCCLADYLDGEGLEEVGGEYYFTAEIDELLEEEGA